MKEKYVIWVFAGAVFLGTLGVASWRHGSRSSDEPGAQLRGATASHSIRMPDHPFQAAVQPQAAPPSAPAAQSPPAQATQSAPAQAPQSPPLSTAGDISPAPIQTSPLAAPDPVYEQSRDDYKQREKLMDEIAARARAQQAN